MKATVYKTTTKRKKPSLKKKSKENQKVLPTMSKSKSIEIFYKKTNSPTGHI